MAQDVIISNRDDMYHIVLYADEMKPNLWKRYCKIMGISPSCKSVTINFDRTLVKGHKEED